MKAILAHISNFFKKVGHFIKNILKVSKNALFDTKKYKLIDEAINGFGFDYGYLYNIEYAKLSEMKDYFEKHGIAANNDKKIKQIDLALKLLKIIKDENVFHYEWHKDCRGKITYSNPKYCCDVEINIRNANRFIKNEKEKEFYINNYPHEIYLLKAKHLYHKVRNIYEQTWWD